MLNTMILCRKKTAFSELTVTEEKNVRTLWSPGGVRQTAVLRDAPWIPILEYARRSLLALAFTPRPDAALVVGLGGGAIPMMLTKARPELRVDIVEIDADMQEIAERYFGFRASSKVHVINDSAQHFLSTAEHVYDLIILDAYLGAEPDRDVVNEESMVHLHNLLTPDGVLVANLMRRYSRAFRRTVARFGARFCDIRLLYGNLSGNVLLFAGHRNRAIERIGRRAAKLQERFRSPIPVTELVDKLCRLPDTGSRKNASTNCF